MRLVALPITRYTVPGPMPFSGIGLPYYDRTLETLFEAINQVEGLMDLTPTAFWSYALEQVAGKYRLLKTDLPLAGDLVWSAEKQYGSDRLTSANPNDHQHGQYSGTAPTEWLADPWTGAAGNGKSFAGNWIEQCRLALLRILEEQGLDPYEWLTAFKETSRVDQIVGAQSAAWVDYGFGKYNLTTDHVEGMRLWPRSVLNMASGGEAWIVDGRLDDEAVTADKAAPWCYPIDTNFGGVTEDVVAVCDSSSATASGVIITAAYLIRWGGNTLNTPANPCGAWVDGCDYPYSISGQAETAHFGVDASGNVSIVGWISGNPSCLGTHNPIRPGMQLTFKSTTPDPDDPDYYALDRSDPVAVPLQSPKGIEVLDQSTLVAAEGGALVLMDWDGSDLHLCSRTPLAFASTGVCGERSGGTAPEGTGLGYRVLVGDEANTAIHAVDLYPGAIAKFDGVSAAPTGAWINLRPSHVYSTWGLCPIPDRGFYFRLLDPDPWANIGAGEASGMSFHVLRGDGNTYRHDAWEIPGVELLAGSELTDDGAGGWYVEVARETRKQWTLPATRSVSIEGSPETYILNQAVALHMWGEIWIQGGQYYPQSGGGLPNLDFLYRDGEAFDPGVPGNHVKAVAGPLGDRVMDQGGGAALRIWTGTSLDERIEEWNTYVSGIQIQPVGGWGDLRPEGEDTFSILYDIGGDPYIASGLWYQLDPNWPGPPPNGPDYRLDLANAWAADWTETNRQSSDTGWEALTATSTRWSGNPAPGTLHRAPLGDIAFLRAWLPFLWQFGLEDGDIYTDDWRLGVSGGKTYRQAFTVEAQYVNAFHRVYGRSVKTLQYRCATAGTSMRWKQVLPANPSDPAAWLAAPEVGRWEGIPAADTLYHEETVTPVGINPWAEPIQPKQDEPMYILMESEADDEIILDSSVTPGVVGLRD